MQITNLNEDLQQDLNEGTLGRAQLIQLSLAKGQPGEPNPYWLCCMQISFDAYSVRNNDEPSTN